MATLSASKVAEASICEKMKGKRVEVLRNRISIGGKGKRHCFSLSPG